MLPLPKDSKGLIRDHVYEALRDRILTLELVPGHFFSEKEAIEMLQVSRTPIREAFVRLAQEGLIETVPQKGSYVSLIDLNQVEETRFVREQLETAIVRLACSEMKPAELLQLNNLIAHQELCVSEKDYLRLFDLDEEFHRVIIYSCGKQRTWAMLQQMSTHLRRLRLLRLSVKHDWEIILQEHKAVVAAIGARDADEAARHMRGHLTRVNYEKLELQKQYPTYFK